VKLQSMVMVLVLLAVFAFAALNWAAFTVPADLSLLVGHVEAPVGLVMIGVVVVLSALYMVFAVGVRTAAFVESRRTLRELREARRLADEAEASRFEELKRFLEQRGTEASGPGDEAAVLARLAAMETAVLQAIDEAHNRLAATMGEMEDHSGGGTPPA